MQFFELGMALRFRRALYFHHSNDKTSLRDNGATTAVNAIIVNGQYPSTAHRICQAVQTKKSAKNCWQTFFTVTHIGLIHIVVLQGLWKVDRLLWGVCYYPRLTCSQLLWCE